MFNKLKGAYLPKTNFPAITVDRSKCKQCRRCFEQCPTYAFEWGEDNFPRPRGFGGFEQTCFNCGNCIAVCPEGAISMEGAYSVPEGRYRTYLTGEMRYPDPLSLGGKKEYCDFESQLTGVERVIYTRRSNRLFKDKEIPEELLMRILEAGRFAPSAGNNQPYKFIVITDGKVIRELERQCMKLLRKVKNLYLDRKGKRRFWKNMLISLLSWMKVNSFDPRPIPAMEKADRSDDHLYFGAPAVILIFKNRNGIGNPDLDAGICSQNMTLAAHSLGLGTCHITFFVDPLSSGSMKEFREELGIEFPWEPVNSIAIGYPKVPIDSVVKRDTPPVEWIR